MKGRSAELTEDEATAVVSSLMNLARRAEPGALQEFILFETSVSSELKSSFLSAYRKMKALESEAERAVKGGY
jgi:hypothetical protein